MFRIISLLLISVVVCSLLLIVPRVTGGLNRSAGEQFVTEYCTPQPCWRGIRPGVTSLDQTRAILQTHTAPGQFMDEYRLCYEPGACWGLSIRSWSADAKDPVSLLTFQPAQGAFRLGDAVALYGDPITSQLCQIIAPSNGDLGPEVQRPVMVAYLTFRGNIKVVAYRPDDPTRRRIDPAMSVYRLYYQVGYDIFSPRWRGFSQQSQLGCKMG